MMLPISLIARLTAVTLLLAGVASAQVLYTVKIQWPSSQDTVSGYKVCYDKLPRKCNVYESRTIDVGNVTAYTFTNLSVPNPYSIAVTAYRNYSGNKQMLGQQGTGVVVGRFWKYSSGQWVGEKVVKLRASAVFKKPSSVRYWTGDWTVVQ